MTSDCSLILKVKKNNSIFICNRNGVNENYFYYYDKYIKWWELDCECGINIEDCSLEILEIVPLGNKNKEDQTLLNGIKRVWIEKIKDSQDEDTIICNSVLKQYEDFRRIMRNDFKYYRNIFRSMRKKEIYEVVKKLWSLPIQERIKWLNTKRIIIDKISGNNQSKAVLMFMRDYLRERVNEKYPFPYGEMYNIISNIRNEKL